MAHIEICSVDLRDPRWRVALYGWFCGQTKPERETFKGADEEKRFHCVSEQELDSLVIANQWALRSMHDVITLCSCAPIVVRAALEQG